MLLLSLPHGGTHFLRNFIGTAPGSESIRGISHLREASPVDGCHLYWGHFDPFEWHWIAPYARLWRTIVPVRDPLTVAISHHVRKARINAVNWGRASIAFDAHVAHYVPLDLLRTEEDRTQGLKDALRAVGLERGDSGFHWSKWAREWDVISQDLDKAHSSGDNWLKQAYRQGDFQRLEEAMPEQISELRKHERTLRPWLERIGYKDLLWWS